MFGVEEFKVRECGSRLILESGGKVVETNLNSGGIWVADTRQLWRPECIAPPKKSVALDIPDLVKSAKKISPRALFWPMQYEAGTSWIGLSGGLGGSQNNAQGFIDELADAATTTRGWMPATSCSTRDTPA